MAELAITILGLTSWKARAVYIHLRSTQSLGLIPKGVDSKGSLLPSWGAQSLDLYPVNNMELPRQSISN